MADTLKEDKEGEFSHFGTSSQNMRMVDERGRLTDAALNELREFKYNELLNLEEKIKNSRLPTEDLFGIKRRFCQVCETGCTGYEPNTIIVPQSGEFPTFCKNCKCPAHFHHICYDSATDLKFPQELKEAVQNHNISSKDINFNCVMMAFEIRSTEMQTQNMNELMAIMKEEGLEVISLERRELEIEEAIYLKSKMIGQTENLMFSTFGRLQEHQAVGKVNEIKRDARYGSTFIGKQGSTDPFMVNMNADAKEAKLIQKTMNLASQFPKEHIEHIPGISINKKPAQMNQLANAGLTQPKIAILDTINQRIGINDPEIHSINRTSNLNQQNQQDEERVIEEQIQMLKRDSMVPMPKNKSFKVKLYNKAKSQIKADITFGKYTGMTIQEEEAMLSHQISKDSLLQELLSKEVILLAIGSATYQGLENKVKNQVLHKIKVFLPPEEMPILYLSETRISSLEDCIYFFPSLFKLTKSIVVSEPIASYSQTQDDTPLIIQDAPQLNQDLQAKIQELNESLSFNLENGGDQSDEDEDFINFYKNRVNMQIKSSSKLKTLLKKREQLKKSSLKIPNGKHDMFGDKINDSEWIERAQQREKAKKKKLKLLSQRNKMLYNFGVMHDFFNYSAMCIQDSLHEIDINNPPSTILRQNMLHELVDKEGGPGKHNIFAIAKVGLPNLILPSSLEVKLSTYNQFKSYLNLCDSFFPNLASSELSILVLRPLMVKNGLNDFMIRILKINEFTILKRKQRMLNNSELAFLSEQESITEDKCEAYYNMMMEGHVEIVVVTKLGAVSDLKTIVDGNAPFGRRRVAQLDEDTSVVRTNVDAVNSMFEITPFTSMSEFIDIEDFIISNTKLEKYKKMFKTANTQKSDRLNDQLYLQKVENLRKEINLFSRYFNIVAHVPSNKEQAQKEVCILMPEVAVIEEVIIILNPLYGNLKDSAEKLIQRMGFKILNHTSITIDEETAKNLYHEKTQSKLDKSNKDLNSSYSLGEKLIKYISGSHVAVWHLAKISADRELRQLYIDGQVELEDILRMRVKSGPFKPQHFPFIFMFMETPYMFETMFRQIWGEKFTQITGQQLIDGFNFNERTRILDIALKTTLGDSIKVLSFDRLGNILTGITDDKSLAIESKIPQIFQLYGNPSLSNSVHSFVESESHGLFEIRFARLPHVGDLSIQIDFSKLKVEKLKMRYFQKFEALNLYYNEVNKYYYNICPAFYRFKISPLVPFPCAGHEFLNRVYEVEEYMGKPFMQDIADMHQDHIKLIKNQQQKSVFSLGKTLSQLVYESGQKSMPPFQWGAKIAKMCEMLQKIKGPSILNGAGRIVFADNQILRGEVSETKDFYEFDKKRYFRYLDDFRKGWSYYLSMLDCQIIENKIETILNSQTFKQSRRAGNLALIPDKMSEINLRISDKIQLIVEDTLQEDSYEKFYKHLQKSQVQPDTEEVTVNMVQSVLHTLFLENTLDHSLIRQHKDNNDQRGFNAKELDKLISDEQKNQGNFSTHKDCAVVGVEVARRPKHQLIASVYYLINFHLRKIDRKTSLFQSLERNLEEDNDTETKRQAELYYDQILDTMCGSIVENFGRDEFNYALDMVSLFDKPSERSEFDDIIKEKRENELKKKEQELKQLEDIERSKRTKEILTVQQLMDLVVKEESTQEEEIKKQELMKRFQERNGSAAGGAQDDEFMQILRDTKSYLGPYSIQMAKDYVRGLEIKEKSKQEKISFVKMEYFLYAMTQAHECVLDLRQMEQRIGQYHDEIESLSYLIASTNGGNTNYAYMKNRNEQGNNNYQQHANNLEKATVNMETLKQQIHTKETHLIHIFRELMSWDFHVPDIYFDKDAMLDRKRQEELQETYQLPMRTFWKPVFFDNYNESDLMNQKFARKFRDYRTKEEIEKDDQEEAQQKIQGTYASSKNLPSRKRKGVLISYLRPYDAITQHDYIKFDKYYSSGEYKDQQDLLKLKTKIDLKLTREMQDSFGQKFRQLRETSSK